MKIDSDWHIHSRNSCDDASMTIRDLIREAEQSGIRDLGLTDHLHTPWNLPDLRRSRREYLAADPSPRATLRRLFLDVETSRQREVDPEVVSLVLESYPSTEGDHLPRYGDLLRAAYRGAAGQEGLPAIIAETISTESAAACTRAATAKSSRHRCLSLER